MVSTLETGDTHCPWSHGSACPVLSAVTVCFSHDCWLSPFPLSWLLTYYLIFMCLFVLSTLLFVSVCISPSRCQRSCLWFIPSVTLQSKLSQMIRDFIHIASKPLAGIVLKRTAWVASCVLTQTIVQVRCVTKFRTWWSMCEEQPGVPFLIGTGPIAFQYPFEKSHRKRENKITAYFWNKIV